MAVPSQGELHRPILEIAAARGGALSFGQYLEFIVHRYSLTSHDLAERVSSGLPRVRVNIGFALHLLDKAGLLNRPSRGHFHITPTGRNYLQGHIGKITTAQLKKLAEQKKPEVLSSSSNIYAPSDLSHDDDASPQDKIDAGYRELQEQLADDLLESLLQVSPDGFERLVVDLLEKMGYGEGEAVGRSGDGGIDGIINQDALGLEKVYLQAKRWQNQVGEPAIRNFSGSLDAKGASKGVFVTTSNFSASARQTAKNISAGPKFIRLIDGPELAKLMMDYNVGVITQYAYKIQELDENYFIDADPSMLDKESYFLDKYADSL